jgi:ankyrin repeat protein
MKKKPVWVVLAIALLLFGCGKSKQQAIEEIGRLNLKFSTDDFVKSVENGDNKAVPLFFQAGIDVNAPNSDGITALMAASQLGRVDIVNKLLDLKADPNTADKDGQTALMLASANNQLPVVQALLKHNADPNLTDHNGWTALMKAVYAGNSKCVEALADRSRQEVNRGLLVAALMGHQDTAKILLDYGAEVDTHADDGRTPLMFAASKGNKDLVAFLLKAGADPSLTDKTGANAAAIAKAKGFADVAAILEQAPPPAGGKQQANAGGKDANKPGAPAGPVTGTGRTVASAKTSTGSAEPTGSMSDAEVLGLPPPKVTPDSSSQGTEGGQPSVLEIKEAFLPVTLTEVTGKRAKIQPSQGEAYFVSGGDQLKGLNYRVLDVETRSTEDKDGNPVDASVVKLKNMKTGETISLIKGIPAQERGSYAILAAADRTLKVEADQSFNLPGDTSHTYKVVDIRPNQVVIRCLEDNRVITLQKR